MGRFDPPMQKTEIHGKAKLLCQSLSQSEAARRLGISRQRVFQILHPVEPLRQAKAVDIYGMPLREVVAIIEQCTSAGLRDPLDAFHGQKANAKCRGIEWQMNFSQWWAIWRNDFGRRGRTRSGLVMCRRGDVGPYAPENVFLATASENLSSYWRENRSKTS